MSDLAAAPEGSWLRGILRRNLRSLAGLGLLILLAAIAVALATWNINDPSLSNAVDGPAQNILGYAGAVIADLAMQIFGIAALLLILPPVFWGWRLLVGAPTRFRRITIPTWLGATLIGAGAIATLPVSANWPLPTGLGGIAGDLILRVPSALFGAIGGVASFLTGAILVILTALLWLHTAGFLPWSRNFLRDEEPRLVVPARTRRRARAAPVIDDDLGFEEEDPDERNSVVTLLFGAVAHIGYRLRSSLSRLKRRGNISDADYLDPEERYDPESELASEDSLLAPDEDFPATDDEIVEVAPPTRPPRRTMHRRSVGAPFELPPLDLLSPPRQGRRDRSPTRDVLEENAHLLESVLDDFGLRGEIVNIWPGPVVTLYELEPAPGIKSSRVISLADDIARSMSAIACRVAVIPGKNAIGIELPNDNRETVLLRELLASDGFADSKALLPFCLGKNIGGEPVIADLSRMPHLLVAGTTGSGKSVSINTMILSLLYRLSPDACRLILIDPKMLELSVYDGIPHLLTPVVTDPKKAVVALKWTVREMEDRYRNMSKLGVRNIDGLNTRVAQARARGEVISRSVHTGFDPDTGDPIMEREELDLEPMPHIVVIIDEMADLMMVAGKDIEGAVQRLAQMARAAGIHVVMATQRPSVDVITGTIKANFPTRISFQVTSKIDSRTILGEQGAEQLLGQGDMLYMMGGGRITRVHGPYVSEAEVEKVVTHLKSQGRPEYLEAITEDQDGAGIEAYADPGDPSNDLYDRAVAIVLRDRKASTSYIQRRLSIGYNRAASIIERMEDEGVVGAANHAGRREILVEGNHDRS